MLDRVPGDALCVGVSSLILEPRPRTGLTWELRRSGRARRVVLHGLHWDTWVLFHPEDTLLIRPGESVPLIQLSDEGLRAQQQSAEASASILRSFHDELVGTEITIHYSDIYGHPQDTPCSKVVRPATTTAYRPDASTGVGVL